MLIIKISYDFTLIINYYTMPSPTNETATPPSAKRAATPSVANKASSPSAPKPAQPKSSPPSSCSTAPQPAVSTTTTKKSIVTTIIAEVDIGWGNQLFIRGQGGGLSWDKGTPMECLSSHTWSLKISTAEPIVFKFLLNDQRWCNNENLLTVPGSTYIAKPCFA